MNGDLAEGVVPDLLHEIYVGRRSGTLTLVRGDERQSLRFRRGHIVNAQTNVVEERLGEMLVRRGLLSEADLARATAIVVRDKRRLGEVLVELSLLDADGLEDAVAVHVHEMLARVFLWREGTFAFDEEPEAEAGREFTLKLSTGELILEAVQAVHDPDVVRFSLGDMDRVLALSSDPLLRFQKLTLSPEDGFVLSRVDGVTSAREIVQMIPLPAERTQRSLLGLVSTGVVEFQGVRPVRKAPRAPAASVGQPNEAKSRPPAATEPPPATPVTPHAAAPQAPAPPQAPAAPPASPQQAAPRPTRAPQAPAASSPPAPSASPPPTAPAVARPDPAEDKAAERRREIIDAWSGLKTRTHFEVLGVSRAVGEAEVKDAYFRLAKRFHPDVHHGASLGDLRDELEAVFIRLGEAYEVLRDPRKRADYEERLGRSRPRPVPSAGDAPAGVAAPEPAPPEPPPDPEEAARRAEDDVRRAAKLVEQEKYWDAIQLLEPAVEAVKGKPRLRARVLLARCYIRNPKWAKSAEATLLAATREEPKAVEPWALLGAIYAEKGLRTRAVAMYRKALELNPEHEEAFKYLAQHAAPTEPPADEESSQGSGGLLGRLFRKG
jgi:tetratricopeptide (TPR) repeat protein